MGQKSPLRTPKNASKCAPCTMWSSCVKFCILMICGSIGVKIVLTHIHSNTHTQSHPHVAACHDFEILCDIAKKNYADYVSLCNAYRSYTKLPRSPMLRKSQPKSATSESEVQLSSWLLVPDDLHNGWLGGIGFSSPKGFNETGPRPHSYKQSQRTSHRNSRRNQQNCTISICISHQTTCWVDGGV